MSVSKMSCQIAIHCGRATLLPPYKSKNNNLFLAFNANNPNSNRSVFVSRSRIRASNGGDSFLDTSKKAVDMDRKSIEFQRLIDHSAGSGVEDEETYSPELLERKSNEFLKILEVSPEERDRVQRMQVIDRAAAAIAAARVLLQGNMSPNRLDSGDPATTENMGAVNDVNGMENQQEMQNESLFVSQPRGSLGKVTPGPDFWSWTPPSETDGGSNDANNTKSAGKASLLPTQISPVMEKEQYVGFLSIPFESKLLGSKYKSSLPPLQSLIQSEKVDASSSSMEKRHLDEERDQDFLFSANAAEAAHVLCKVNELSYQGINPDGSRWWKETGSEKRPDGVICRWTLLRGVSADHTLEWEEKYWEAADESDYKELGSEKSGRDAAGNIWCEYWKESMWQNLGLLNFEKTADKWGKNAKGYEWQEKWCECYDASGQAEKWAHKWCSISPNTLLEPGHAHIWHERWGEQFDGHGGSTKYTDKWAERCEGDVWEKWGDKWDEHFDMNGRGVKQGETWWQGKRGEHWNRTWGEGHNGSGWVHKYGKSSCGEHWDTHVEQETWYERFPHYGFHHCFENSVQLRQVKRPSESS